MSKPTTKRQVAMETAKATRGRIAASILALAALFGATTQAEARPTYFETLKSLYAIPDESNLDACGVCHFLWTGTGARNPFGNSVEQQLYLGKSITQSLMDVELMDPDLDGFTSLDELTTYLTLPGYSCANFQQAVGAPTGYDTYIEPLVASCLEPLDIRVTPSSVGFLVEVGEVDVRTIEIFNNGTDFPLDILDYGLSAGIDPAFSFTGPVAPFSIPVGQSVVVEISFAPNSIVLTSGSFDIESNDPDPGEAMISIPVSGFGIIKNVAEPEERSTCLASIDKAARKYTKTHLREWTRCYQDELTGKACDTGRRDLKLAGAEDKLLDVIGGDKDKFCKGAGLNVTGMDFPEFCGGTCADIEINTIADFGQCLICRQDEAMSAVLNDAMGTLPPDLPPNTLTDPLAISCQKKLLKASFKGVTGAQKVLAPCELANVTAITPSDCVTDLAANLEKVNAKVDKAVASCKATTDMLGCSVVPMPDPECLGDSAQLQGQTLVEQVFAVDE